MYECKKIKDENLISNSEILSEPIWLNNRFKFNGKIIFISNWTKSNILYVKDLFDEDGNFITETNLILALTNSANWMAEYTKIKKIMKKNQKSV